MTISGLEKYMEFHDFSRLSMIGYTLHGHFEYISWKIGSVGMWSDIGDF